MRRRFHIGVSYCKAALVVCLYLLAMLCVCFYNIPLLWQLAVLGLLLALLTRQIYVTLYSHITLLEYQPRYSRWALSEGQNRWQYFERVELVYENQWFVWIHLLSSRGKCQSSLICADSLTDKEFLDLCRCIICPSVMNHHL